jgi:hypothetical protein
MSDTDLQAAAQEEMLRACDLSWRELAKVVPWGDTYEGFTPGGRTAQFERNYLWANAAQGDILVEVVVYLGQRQEDGVKLSRVIGRRTT